MQSSAREEVKQRNIKLFYWHQLFYQFNHMLVAFIQPIFLYKLFDSIIAVFLWGLVWSVFFLLTFLPGFNLAMRAKHPKYIMALGVIFNCLSFIFFACLDKEHLLYIVPAMLFSCAHLSSYWMVRHWFFSVNANHRKIGGQISTLGVIQVFISCIAPLIGGFISFIYSFNATFLLGAVTMCLALIPVLLFDDQHQKTECGIREALSVMRKPELKAISFAYFSEGAIENFFRTSWILLFALFIGNVKDFGTLVGGTTLISAVLIYLTGKAFDKRNRHTVLKWTTSLSTFSGLLYAVLLVFPSALAVWIFDTLNRLSNQMHDTVVQSYLFGFSNKVHPVHFHINREVYVSVGRIISNIIMIGTLLIAPVGCLWVFLILGALMFLGWLSLKNSDYLLEAEVIDLSSEEEKLRLAA